MYDPNFIVPENKINITRKLLPYERVAEFKQEGDITCEELLT